MTGPTSGPLDGIRSLLFVPAGDRRKLERAWSADAGAVVADLEDAVAEGEKDRARATLAEHLAQAGAPRGALVVRINALGSAHSVDDLRLVRSAAAVDAVLIPKATAAGLCGLTGVPPVVALVETAAGIVEAPAIAVAPGVAALMIGTIDLAAELGLELTADGAELAYARSALVVASAAAGLRAPIDGVWPAVADPDGLATEAARSRALGFGAKACIHPAQLAAVEACFAPTEAELAWAAEVVEAYERALADGRGAVAVAGRMVDKPVVARARRVLAAG